LAGVGNTAVLGADALTEAVTGEKSDLDQYAKFTGIKPFVSSGLDALGVPRAEGATQEMLGSAITAGSGALGGVGMGKLIAQGIGVGANAIRSGLTDMPARQVAGSLTGDVASQGATALTNSPMAGAVAGMIGGSVAGYGAPKPQPLGVPKMQPEELGKLINMAAQGNTKAKAQLAQVAKVNPQLVEDARALGFDLPADMFADDRMVQQAAGLTRSQVATQDSVMFDDTVARAVENADRVISDLGATADISTLNQRVSDQMQDVITKGRSKSGSLYSQVDEKIAPSAVASMDNTYSAIRDIVTNLGGNLDTMSAPQRKLYSRLFDAKGNPKVVTYQALRNLKEDIQNAAFGKGELDGLPGRDAKILAKALRDDQLLTARDIGGADLERKLSSANKINSKIERVKDQAISLFGKEFEKSIATPLTTSVGRAAKGDIGNLRKMLNAIPKQMRREALLTSIIAGTRAKGGQTKGDFGMSEFSSFMKGLDTNKKVRQEIALELGGETMRTLESLGRIADAVTTARANVITTGKANQDLLRNLSPERMLTTFAGSAPVRMTAQAATLGTGVGPNIIEGAAKFAAGTPQDDMKKVNALFNDSRFMGMISDVASGRKPSIPRVASSPAFVSWANASGIKNPRAWLTNFVQQIQGVEGNG